MRAVHSAVLLTAIACLTAGPSAQGLADAARRGCAAPQQPATKKYTNDDVEAARPVAPPAPEAAAAHEAPAGAGVETTKTETANEAGAAAEAVKAADPATKNKQEDVLSRIAQLKTRLANKEKQLADLQTRGASSDVVTKQIAGIQIELKVLEARLSSRE
jgi:hypothetical protein